jgi:carbon monoxide dehydrogenase subunit G
VGTTHLEGTARLGHAREDVWRAAADPRTLASCPDAAGSVEVVDDRHARVAAPVGGSGGLNVQADVEWTDLRPIESLTVVLQAAVAGMAVTLPARIDLRDDGPDATIVSWSADVLVTGPFAGFAGGLVVREVQGLIDGLVACVERILSAGPAGPGG